MKSGSKRKSQGPFLQQNEFINSWQPPIAQHNKMQYVSAMWYIYIYIYIQRITMCPHGYHHSGSMATPALGTRDVRLHIVWIALWSHQSAQTASSERCIVQKVNVPQGALHPIQESAQTAQAVSEISKGLQCALTAITIVALWQLPLADRMKSLIIHENATALFPFLM